LKPWRVHSTVKYREDERVGKFGNTVTVSGESTETGLEETLRVWLLSPQLTTARMATKLHYTHVFVLWVCVANTLAERRGRVEPIKRRAVSVGWKWGLIGGGKENEERTKAGTSKSRGEGGPENHQEH
jgi:hypothetical protein